jgi:hypothetical protein
VDRALFINNQISAVGNIGNPTLLYFGANVSYPMMLGNAFYTPVDYANSPTSYVVHDDSPDLICGPNTWPLTADPRNHIRGNGGVIDEGGCLKIISPENILH